MHVDIIIPTLLRKPEYLQKCLRSVQASQTDHTINLFIVGNVSEHELYKFRDEYDAFRFQNQSQSNYQNEIQNKYQNKSQNKSQSKSKKWADCTFHWRALGGNYGFTGAVNSGAELGTSPLIVLLNDDAEVTPGWLNALVKKQTETSAAMVASHILLAETKTVDSLGFTFLWRGKALAIQDLAKLHDTSDNVTHLPSDHWLRFPEFVCSELSQNTISEPFGPDAAAALYTRELWLQLGGLKNAFFAYLEDVDFALRARLLGHECVLANDAVVYHHKHATSVHFSGFKAKQDMLNWWRIVLCTYPSSAWWRFGASILLERLKNLNGFLKSL
jgi:GT2 family glycosyltransferase